MSKYPHKNLFQFFFSFSGDTLFVGGCGKFFEGTPEQMYHALCEVLGSLPDDTVYMHADFNLLILYIPHHSYSGFIILLFFSLMTLFVCLSVCCFFFIASLLWPRVYCEQPALCPACGARQHCYQRENCLGNGRQQISVSV